MFGLAQKFIFSANLRRALARGLIFALLLASALHLYLHVLEASLHKAYTVVLAQAHVESAHGDHPANGGSGADDIAAGGHASLLSLLKHFAAAAFGVLFSFLLSVLFLPFVLDGFVYIRTLLSRLSCGDYFTPPLRAPPR